jgi:hypothetical protein
MKKILIKKCNDQQKWYADMIGFTVPYLGNTGQEFKSREPGGFVNFVSYTDGEVIENDYSNQ